MKPIFAIVATDISGGFAKENKIPWKIKGDTDFFKNTTTKSPENTLNAIIMGRKTFESMGCKFLPGRVTIVLSSQQLFPVNTSIIPHICVKTLDAAIEYCNAIEYIHHIFIIGGWRLYRESIEKQPLLKIYKTVIHKNYGCDTFFPFRGVEDGYTKESSVDFVENDISYCIETWGSLGLSFYNV